MLAAAALVCLTGCKKDDEGEKITLGVDFEQTAGMQKTYIGNSDKTIYWSTDDNVQVNGTNYLVHDGVVEVNMCDDGYAAVYPATNTLTYSSETHSGKTCIGGSVVIPATQTYAADANGIQQLNGPMAARLDTKTGRLLFRNLYAVIKVTVDNRAYEQPFTLNSITLESANGVNLTGTQPFTFSGSTTDVNNIGLGDLTNGSTCVTLMFNTPVTIPAEEKDSFYLYTAPFSHADLTVRLNGNLTDHPGYRYKYYDGINQQPKHRIDISIERSTLRSTTVFRANALSFVDLGHNEECPFDGTDVTHYWYPCNVGASNPGEYGDYYAWGEEEPYYSNLDPLTWKEGKNGYNQASYAGTAPWGFSPSIPEEEQFQELINFCDWTWTDNYLGKGIKGWIIANRAPHRKDICIFLPAAGYINGTEFEDVGTEIRYWSCTVDEENTSNAYILQGNSVSKSVSETELRYVGIPLRLVMRKPN